NPAFVASLPNRFVAIVPEACVQELADGIERAVRGWVLTQGRKIATKLVERAGAAKPDAATQHIIDQIERQLRGFPEIHWAAVPWRLGGSDETPKTDGLSQATRVLVGGTPEGALLGTPAWQVLAREIAIEGTTFYRPNPGVFYPDLYQLLDRLVAATKATRTFDATCERGYRCSVCGEREWLTDDDALLMKPRGQRKDTLWTRIGERNPSWARKGEHLCALCALKRLWAALFAEELAPLLKQTDDSSRATAPEIQRFVVSTHTMALAPTLDRMLGVLYGSPSGEQVQALGDLDRWMTERKVDDFVALPKRIADVLTRRKSASPTVDRLIRRLPALLDRLADDEDEEGRTQAAVRSAVARIAGVPPERYYALILLDGDRMGAWLSGTEAHTRTTFLKSWHPNVASEVKRLSNRALADYVHALRPPSPARHAFISRALNGFAIRLARLIVEERYNGKLLYAGGDDLLAMVAIDDLLDVLFALRCAYSGIAPGDDVELKDLLDRAQPGPEVRLGGGHALLARGRRRELLRTMGPNATLSAGAVIAHYAAPLGRVLRELRAAERRAKARDQGNRNAFSVTLMKRAGGVSTFTSKWFPGGRDDADAERPPAVMHEGEAADFLASRTGIGLLIELRDAFARHLSRRAAYYLIEWLNGVGPGVAGDQLVALLGYQFARQAKQESLERGLFEPNELAEHVVEVAAPATTRTVRFIQDALTLAEFLAREGRVGSGAGV
ncbi:MAG: type III-B CRISPR-associated protein Cas10/Cmr2, partial [Armatimonadota bacterium]|nr:type III-B CRISPR-associated protein Cas10/Cmr2 [Armatimonadota bacterium]